MKIACWVLLALAALALLCGIGGKLLGQPQMLGFVPGSWWKLSVALALLSVAAKVVLDEGRPKA